MIMKHIFIIALILLAVSCQDDNNILDDELDRGGLIEFAEIPDFSPFNILDFANVSFTANVVDPNNNATSYDLTLIYNDVEVDNFLTVTSFPNSFTILGQDILDALGISSNDLAADDSFRFVATVTTTNGIFIGLPVDFNPDTNEQEGGSIAPNVFSSSPKNALDFRFTLFFPPPKKLRGTSFEEPFAAADPSEDYIRTADNDVEGELLNNPGQRHVMHTAVGTGLDDEIGFRSEFFSNGNGGFSNEEIGVTQKTEDVGGYIDGIQGFQLEDVDGLFRLTFDTVNVDPVTNPQTGVQIQYFLRSTSWEDDDTLRIYAMIERAGAATETIELLNLSGSGLNDVEGLWRVADSGFLDNITAYTLIIDAEIDSGNEEIYFDSMLVYVPEN